MTDSSGIDDATRAINYVLDRLGPPPTDPAETWRATFAAFGQPTSAQLRQAQRDLAASQADLTRVEAERDVAREMAKTLSDQHHGVLRELNEARARLDETARALATANYRNRILTAENDAALRRLNEAGQSPEEAP